MKKIFFKWTKKERPILSSINAHEETGEHCSDSFRHLTGLRLARFVAAMLLLLTVINYAQNAKAEPISPEQMQEIELHYVDAIRPQTVEKDAKEAIVSGFVILYGQMVDPPYQITISNNTLFLNGVQIDSPIMPPWKHRTSLVSITERDQQISDLTKRIRAVYHKLKVQGQQFDGHAELIQYIADEEKAVQTAEWVGSDKMHLVMATGEEFSMIFHDPSLTATHSQIRNGLLRDAKNRYEVNLRNGALLVVGYGPVLSVPAEYVVETLEQIDSGLLEYSTEKLRDVLHHDELVREMLFMHDRL